MKWFTNWFSWNNQWYCRANFWDEAGLYSTNTFITEDEANDWLRQMTNRR